MTTAVPNPEQLTSQSLKKFVLLLCMLLAYTYSSFEVFECHCYYRVSYLQQQYHQLYVFLIQVR
jgi:hypothetical protein